MRTAFARQADRLTWAEIEAITAGRLGDFRSLCPLCSGARSTAAHRAAKVLRVWAHEPDFTRYCCAHCGASGWAAPDRDPQPRIRRHWRPPHQPYPGAAERLAFAQRIAEGAGPVAGLALRYLKRRALGGPFPDDLRFHPSAPYGYASERRGPALLAIFRAPDGRLSGVQVVHLDPAGAKVRRTSFGALAPGGAVRLAPAGKVLAVAEGVETGLAFSRLDGSPCWACLGTAGLAAFQPPPGVDHVIIAADHDPPGLAAAGALRDRLSVRFDVTVCPPPRAGTDWNDALSGRW